MQQVADWLEKLGLGQYAQRFGENGISAAALPHLTDQDLKDIGVLLEHRRIILAAVTQLSGLATPTPPLETAVEPETQYRAGRFETPSVQFVAAASGERRHVTVMFCDLVYSV